MDHQHKGMKNHFWWGGSRWDAVSIFQVPRVRAGKSQEWSRRKTGSHQVALAKKPKLPGNGVGWCHLVAGRTDEMP